MSDEMVKVMIFSFFVIMLTVYHIQTYLYTPIFSEINNNSICDNYVTLLIFKMYSLLPRTLGSFNGRKAPDAPVHPWNSES